MTTFLYTGDVSNWNGPLARPLGTLRKSPAVARAFTSPESQCLLETFDFLIIRGSVESSRLIGIAQQQLGAWGGNGKPTGSYLWAYGTSDPVQDVGKWVAAYDSYVDSKICWLDVEDEDSFASNGIGYNQQWMLNAFQAMRDAGYQPGVYASPDTWKQITGSMTLPDDVLVWLAYWNYQSDLAVPLLGGRPAVGHQFEGSGQAPPSCGLAIDLSDFDAAVIMASIPGQGGGDGDTGGGDTNQYATSDDLQRLNTSTVARFLGLDTLAPLFRQSADIIDANCGPDAPAPSASLPAVRRRVPLAVRTGRTDEVPPPPMPVPEPGGVNATPTIQQILTGFLIDILSPEFMFAVLASLGDWTAGLHVGAPITWLLVAQGVIVALLAGVRAVKTKHQATGMGYVLRSAGLINQGK